MDNPIVTQILNLIVAGVHGMLLPAMCGCFVLGIFLRWIIFLTVRCEFRFAQEFEKRVHKYLAGGLPDMKVASFHYLTKRVLENTYYEHFELRRKYHRRRFDHVTSLTDRIFLIQEGAARLIRDTLAQTQYLRKDGKTPKFLDVSKFVFSSNPVFNRIFASLPLGVCNDLVNILPGLFVIGGILGTFINVMQALPQLSAMDVTNVESTRKIMDAFLLNIALSMGSSVLGIFFSVCTTIVNSVMSPDAIYVNAINKFTSSLEFLWNDASTNEIAAGDRVTPGDRLDRRSMVFQNPDAEVAKTAASAGTPPPVRMNTQFNEPKDPLQEAIGSDPADMFREEVRRDEAKAQGAKKRIEDLEKKIKMIDLYLDLAFEDKNKGVITEEIWKDKSTRWFEERFQLQQELARLTGKDKKVA